MSSPMERMAMQRRNQAQPKFSPMHGGGGAPGAAPPARFAATNRVSRDRNANVITTREWDEMVEAREDSGRSFRRWFYVFILVVLALLALSKYDQEYNIEIPQIGDGTTDFLSSSSSASSASAAGEGNSESATTIENSQGQGEIENFYKLLNVKGRIRTETPEDAAATTTTTTTTTETADEKGEDLANDPELLKQKQDEAKERRRENFRVRKELKRALDTHNEGYGQLVHCGRTCKSEHKQVELAYNTLAGQIDRELYGVLLDRDAKQKKSVGQGELKDAFERKKKEIEETEQGDDKEMALEEIKDAFEILANPEARMYYHLYGRKPPDAMKFMSARHGGWGQDLLLRTWKNRLILQWMDFMGADWFDYFIYGAIGFFGFGLPVIMQLPEIYKMAVRIEENMREASELEKKYGDQIGQ